MCLGLSGSTVRRPSMSGSDSRRTVGLQPKAFRHELPGLLEIRKPTPDASVSSSVSPGLRYAQPVEKGAGLLQVLARLGKVCIQHRQIGKSRLKV
jgi:hypothetical protein